MEVDTITYNSLISACAKVKKSGAKIGAKFIFEMLKSKVEVDTYTLLAVLSCCSGLDSDEKRNVMEAVLGYPRQAVTKYQLNKFPIHEMLLLHFGGRDGQEYYERLESAERPSVHRGGRMEGQS